MDHAMVRGLILVSLLAAITFAWQFARVGDFELLWLTPDQQARRAYDGLEFKEAYEQFEDPAWKGVAAYDSGLYEESAAAFGRIPTTVGFYNRGNAFMKARDYGKAIVAYEQAVAEAPDWVEARENLELATYTLEYIERVREQSDTGDESELSADDYVFDNTKDRGLEMEITRAFCSRRLVRGHADALRSLINPRTVDRHCGAGPGPASCARHSIAGHS
jgi:Ca-activated chloride channel family protein